VPSVTETLSAWNRTPVACTRFCERPDLPHVGGTKDPDVSRIADLSPDLVVLDAQENRVEDFNALRDRGLAVIALDVRSVADVAPALTRLAAAVAANYVAPIPPEPLPGAAPVFVPIWRRPWIALGQPTYGADLLLRLGHATVFADDGPYPRTTLAAAKARGPDLVIAPSEPYPFSDRQRAELETVAPTCFVDGRDLFWWGVRTPDAIARLRAALAEAPSPLSDRHP
jgi:hypothetical protein